jgi:hypothetical protein
MEGAGRPAPGRSGPGRVKDHQSTSPATRTDDPKDFSCCHQTAS